MTKLIYCLLFLFFAFGCSKAPKKPFIVVSKWPYYDKSCKYYYTDANGNTKSFVDTSVYHVGDTLK